jgi:sortase A
VVLLEVMRLRLVLALVIAVVLANAAVLLGVLDDDTQVEARSGGDVAAAAVALATTFEPAVEAELDPLAGVTLSTVSLGTEVDAAAPLPVPENPPANPYAAEPEIRHGTLEIPAIGLRQPLFEGVSLTAINRGPSHWPGTAMPGELGNVVVAGHRTTYTRPFWDLDLVQPGDELIFAMHDGTRHVYAATGIEVVDANAIHIIDQGIGHTATLFACHPKGSARQRIVGHFELVESVPPA